MLLFVGFEVLKLIQWYVVLIFVVIVAIYCPGSRRVAGGAATTAAWCCGCGYGDFARFLDCIMSEMEILFYWVISCMFRDMRSVFWLEWW